MRRPLQAIAARVDRLAAEHIAEAPPPDATEDELFLWAVKHYGLARILAEPLERTDRDRSRARRRRHNAHA